MKSYRRKIEQKFDADERRKLFLTGVASVNGVKASISEQGLVETTRMLNDVRPQVGDHHVSFGTTIDNPNYPFFLDQGFVHVGHRIDAEGEDEEPQEATVGPYRFMAKGQANTEDEVRRIWKAPIR